MKKLLSVLFAAAMLAVCALGFAGCGNANEIVIGLVGPYTGDTAQYGLAVQYGARLYFDEVNAAGGINSKQVKVIYYDSKGDPTEAVTAFTRLVDEKMTAFLGGVLTGETLAIVPEAFSIKMPTVTASATADAVTVNTDTQEVYTNVFRTCFIDPFQGTKIADYASEILGAKTAAIIYNTDDDYSSGLKDAFVAECAIKGITIVQTEGYGKGTKDFKAQLTNIQGKNPDVVFCPNYYEDDGMIVTQAREVGITCKFLGGDGWGGVSKYASPADLEGCIYASGFDDSSDAVKEFKTKYFSKYGDDAAFNMFAALAYDAAKVLVNAITVADNKIADADYSSAEFKAAVTDAIRNNSGNVSGLTTNGYSFDAKNNPVKAITVVECINGVETSKGLY